MRGNGLWLHMVLYQKFLGQAKENTQSFSQFRRSVEGDSKADVLKTNLLGYRTQIISRGRSIHDYRLSKAVKKQTPRYAAAYLKFG